jgi:biopolymer transport protein ExbD
MEPSTKKQQETDPRYLNQDLEDQEDQEVLMTITAEYERVLRQKNLQIEELQDELKCVKEVVKRDPSLRVFVKIGINTPLEAIKVIFNLFICFLKLIF